MCHETHSCFKVDAQNLLQTFMSQEEQMKDEKNEEFKAKNSSSAIQQQQQWMQLTLEVNLTLTQHITSSLDKSNVFMKLLQDKQIEVNQ